jgi:hypothetical protein
MLRRLASIGLIVLFAAGCRSSKMPPLNSVKGRATRGGAPVEFVMIRLIPDTNMPDFSVMGLSDSSGEIDVYTIEGSTNRRKSGAPEGTYAIRVMPPMDDKQHGGEQFTLAQKITVQKGDNTLPTIEINRK